MIDNFESVRRQPYISEDSYLNTIKHYMDEEAQFRIHLKQPSSKPGEFTGAYRYIALGRFESFQLKYTAGEPIENLVNLIDSVVEAFEDYVEECNEKSDFDYYPPLMLDDRIDNYVVYLNLLSIAVLLHREDLIPRIYWIVEGGDYDERDAVIEEILKFFIPDRPSLDNWIWEQPYRKLLDSIDDDDPSEQSKLMKIYVVSWYKSMKGRAKFWGAHENITAEFSPYDGYWAMCAGAYTYLYGIDDSSYRNELAYPKDLVDYARSLPRSPVKNGSGDYTLRAVGGDRCPLDGIWITPADEHGARRFSIGEVMPSINVSVYGTTIWQWHGE